MNRMENFPDTSVSINIGKMKLRAYALHRAKLWLCVTFVNTRLIQSLYFSTQLKYRHVQQKNGQYDALK